MKTILLLFTLIASFAFNASAQIIINIVTPAANSTVGTNMLIEVEVTSTFQITGVVANVSGKQVTLVYNSDTGYFTGNISLTGLNQGTHQLNVTAKDIFNNQQNVVRSFVFDMPPTLIVDSPLNNSVARPLLPVVLSWDDLDSCMVRIEWHDNNTTILHNAKHRDTLNITLDLAPFNGTARNLYIYVTDNKNQSTVKVLNIYVDSSSTLIQQYVSTTTIMDFNYNRVFATGDTGLTYPSVTDVTKRLKTIIPFKMQVSPMAFVTPYGAVMCGVDSSLYPQSNSSIWIYDWNLGTTYMFDKLNSPASARVAGDYVIWNDGNGGYHNLTRRNLSTRTNVPVSTNAGNINNSIASNGMVAYWDLSYNVYKYENGTSTLLTDNSGNKWNTYPFTDGNYIVYRKQDPCCSNQHYNLRLIAGNADSLLSDLGTVQPEPGFDYQVKNKFVAYSKLGVANETQVFVRDSLGNTSQRSFFGSSSSIDLLNSGGDVAFINGAKRYLSLRSGQSASVNTALGKAYSTDSGWFVAIGRVLYKVADVIARNNFVWTGNTNNNWNNSANWMCNCIPSAGADVTIRGGSAPMLNDNVTVGAIALQGTLSLAGYTLTVNGAVTGSGAFTGSATSSMIINGNAGVLHFTQPGRLHLLQLNADAIGIVSPGTLTVGP